MFLVSMFLVSLFLFSMFLVSMFLVSLFLFSMFLVSMFLVSMFVLFVQATEDSHLDKSPLRSAIEELDGVATAINEQRRGKDLGE